MKIRITFECSRCGSLFFRPSMKRTFKDVPLSKIGVKAQRCYRCRRRFYLFRPVWLNAFLKALVASPAPQKPELSPQPANMVWRSFVKADQREGPS
jgi:hypothetical protein